ncbi:LuxR C-terminal-related transcriptional regulator [Streptomyces sp. NPDC002577]
MSMTSVLTAAAPTGDPLLAAKFSLPAEPRTYVHRQRLVDRLSGAVAGPLTLITGPAGAGKTTLAASWARRGAAPGPVVWLTLEPPDDAPGVFWAYVLEALRRKPLPLGEEVGAPASAGGVDQSLLARLVCALDRLPEPVVLVLDGVDALRCPEVTGSLGFVLDHVGDRLRLVLTSRVEPLLPLHRYRAGDRLTEIRWADLAFTVHEARRLLRRHGLTPDRVTVEALTGRTEGWAAGLRLCALSMERRRDPAEFARSFAASEQAVADYLLAEVLDAQLPATQELLLRTSILDRVHPELANALTGGEEAEPVLARLIRDDAFLEPLTEAPWCRFHPLFADVLHTHLRRRHPGLEPRLHRSAAHWLARAGQTVEAVGHATAAGDWQFASAEVIEQLMVGRLLAGPDVDRLTGLLSRMPDDVLGPEPALVAAACRLARGDASGCRKRLAALGPHLQRGKATVDGTTATAVLLTHALLRLLCGPSTPGGCAGAQRTARQVAELMAQMPGFRIEARPEIEALRRHGLADALLRSGRLADARAAYSDTVDACSTRATCLVRHTAMGKLALTEAIHGSLVAAAEHAALSAEVADRHGVPPLHRSGAGHLALAAVACEHGDPHTARHHLAVAEGCSDVHRDPVLTTERALLRSKVELEQGRMEAAAVVLDSHGTDRTPWTTERLAMARSALAMARGDADAAINALESPAEPAGPSRTAALALAHIAAGHTDAAQELARTVSEAPQAGLADRVRARLVHAHAALLHHDATTARKHFRQALSEAAREGLRQLFTETGPWPRELYDGRVQQVVRPKGASVAPPALVEPLSKREREVLTLVAQMMSTEEIAAELHLSVNTVKTHLRSIYHKLCVSRRRDAVERGRQLRILRPLDTCPRSPGEGDGTPPAGDA